MSQERIQEIQKEYGGLNLIDMVHRFLAEENQKNQIKRAEEGRTGKFYPSSVGRCRRQNAYQMLGYPGKPIPGRNLLIMDNGTYFHERMEDLFERMGILIAPELKLKHEELRISGRSDAIIWNFMKSQGVTVEGDQEIELYKPVMKDGQDIGETELVYKGLASDVLIVEFKSIKNKGYEKLPKTKPKKEHEMQLQLYFYLTGIRAGMVYYENKDTQEQKYYYVQYNEAIVQKVITDIKYVIEHIDQGKLPEREFQPVSFNCQWCDYKDICYPPKNTYDLSAIL